MKNPVTPNIGLNKIDRTSPSTTYFDLEKYIDQNADAVDRFAGESSEAIGALEKRLDTEERREVILQPGLQIVNAERSAPFKLSGIKGRTLVNLLGQDGKFLSTTPWTNYGGAINVSNEKLTITGGGSSNIPQISNPRVGPVPSLGDVYLIRIKVSVVEKSDKANYLGVYLYNRATQVRYGENYQYNPSVNKEYELFGRLVVTQEVIDGWSSMAFISSVSMTSPNDANGVIATFREAALYKIATADKGLELDKLKKKYPFTTGIAGVINPFIIRYGDNLLPPFYEWTPIGVEGVIDSPYSVSFKVTNAQKAFYYIDIALSSDTTYTFSAKHNGYLSVTDLNSDRLFLDNTTNQSGTFTTTTETTARVYVSNVQGTAKNGNFSFNNPMLTHGPILQPFKPREDSILGLQTELYADPITGATPDEVFDKDGQYYKLVQWKKIELRENLPWYVSGSLEGFKIIGATGFSAAREFYTFVAQKFDGKLLSNFGTMASPDNAYFPIADPTQFQISISDKDSGWGDNYTPTSDEINAFFMGWTMYDGTGGNQSPNTCLYNGIGTKWWARRSDGISRVWVDATAVLPTVQAPSWTPYQLVYQLAKPIVESVISEGLLTFNEGDNQIEVGTGIVLRESVEPAYIDHASRGPSYYINGDTPQPAKLKHRPKQIMAVYRRQYRDNWNIIDVSADKVSKFGKEQAFISLSIYDPSATYSVTYLMLDESPIVPFTGSYTANEKSMFQELTNAMQHNATAVSVLMNKKVDKDASGWIYPTLLNSWTGTVRYQKDSLGNVYIVGRPGGGTTGNGVLLFTLPEGYRPSDVIVFSSLWSSGSALFPLEITINTLGHVQIWNVGGNTYLDICLPPFLAEQ